MKAVLTCIWYSAQGSFTEEIVKFDNKKLFWMKDVLQ